MKKVQNSRKKVQNSRKRNKAQEKGNQTQEKRYKLTKLQAQGGGAGAPLPPPLAATPGGNPKSQIWLI